MTAIIIIASVIVFYVIPCYLAFRTVQKIFYHPHGYNYGKEENTGAYLNVFTPFFNILTIIEDWRKDEFIPKTKTIFYTEKYLNNDNKHNKSHSNIQREKIS